tara:strand:- start:31 stop:258 length:228 start_codon:yes stop_codon:yes gene_type:complete
MQPLYWNPKRIKELKDAGYRLHFDQSSLVKKSDQVISHSASTEANSRRAPGPGLKQQASSAKLLKEQATSIKRQA